MSRVEAIRPTVSGADTTGGGNVVNGPNAFDQNESTYAALNGAVTGGSVVQILSGFPDDTNPTRRTSVVVSLKLARVGWTLDDQCVVYFQVAVGEPWVIVAEFFYADLTTSAVWYDVDVSPFVGATPSSGWRIGVGNYDGPPPGPPDPQIPG